MAVMELQCPNRHLVGRIIKHSVVSPLLLDMPKRLREDWKQVSERPMLTTHCGVCKRAVSKATDTVKERVDRLIDDEWEHKNQYVLPFLITSEDWAQTAYTAHERCRGPAQHLALYEGGDIVSVTLFACKGHAFRRAVLALTGRRLARGLHQES